MNQDSYILTPNIEGLAQNFKHFFSVCDGHGTNGHYVSAFVKERLPELVKHHMQQAKLTYDLDETVDKLTVNDYKAIFENAFLDCDREMIEDQDEFNVKLSGTTVCSVLFDGTRVHCANAGDSRAMTVRIFKNQELGPGRDKVRMVSVPLSVDHKPELPEERKRILEKGGRIDSFHDADNNNEPLGPQRVWLPDQELPGLAMSRSLGDTVAHSVGVSSAPEVKSFLISPDDKFIVIGSDGVWEFLSNE